MRKVGALLGIALALAGFAMIGCESEAPKKPPEQKSDLGEQGSPTPGPAKTAPSTNK